MIPDWVENISKSLDRTTPWKSVPDSTSLNNYYFLMSDDDVYRALEEARKSGKNFKEPFCDKCNPAPTILEDVYSLQEYFDKNFCFSAKDYVRNLLSALKIAMDVLEKYKYIGADQIEEASKEPCSALCAIEEIEALGKKDR